MPWNSISRVADRRGALAYGLVPEGVSYAANG